MVVCRWRSTEKYLHANMHVILSSGSVRHKHIMMCLHHTPLSVKTQSRLLLTSVHVPDGMKAPKVLNPRRNNKMGYSIKKIPAHPADDKL